MAVSQERHAETARRAGKDPLVSLVIPVFNEEASVAGFVEAVRPCLTGTGHRFELVFVNDGSRDGTLRRLLGLGAGDDRIRIVNLSRNFGKEAALSAGLDYARGDVVIPMDVDLQDPPELIPAFLEEWRKGYDVVYGVRAERAGDTFAKRASARAFYRLFNRLSALNIPADAGDFRLLDRRVVDVIRRLPERNRFMKGLFAWAGFRTKGIPYERPGRAAGASKWSYSKLLRLAWDGIVSFSSVPLKVWTYVGAFVASFAFLYAIFIILNVLITGVDVPGYASLLTAMLFLGGIQLLSLGILGEYISRVFIEVKGRPVYVVEGVYGGARPDTPERPVSGPQPGSPNGSEGDRDPG